MNIIVRIKIGMKICTPTNIYIYTKKDSEISRKAKFFGQQNFTFFHKLLFLKKNFKKQMFKLLKIEY